MYEWCVHDLFVKDDYVVSNDGFTMELPHPDGKKFIKKPAWWHVDQMLGKDGVDEGVKYLQMSLALNENVTDGACFACFPGSHKYFKTFMAGTPANEGNVYRLRQAEIEALEREGYAQKRVYCQKGDVIIWDSRLVHMGASAQDRAASSAVGRAAVFACLLPRRHVPSGVLTKKKEAWAKGKLETCTHKPDVYIPFKRGAWFPSELEDCTPPPRQRWTARIWRCWDLTRRQRRKQWNTQSKAMLIV